MASFRPVLRLARMYSAHLRRIALLCVAHTTLLVAQTVTVDPTFNPGDGGNGFGDGALSLIDGHVQAIALRPDGRQLVGGYIPVYSGTSVGHLVQVQADGTLDPSFQFPGANADVRALALQDDGRVLVGGEFTTVGSVPHGYLVRLNTDGSVDATFNLGTGPDYYVNAIAVQPDGRVMIAGGFQNVDGTPMPKVARLNADGSLDMTFTSAAQNAGAIWSLALRPDGKAIIGGNFFTYGGVPRYRIARLNPDGALDTTFVVGEGCNSDVYAVRAMPNGDVVLAGDFTSYDNVPRVRVARLDSTGALTTFNPGVGPNNAVRTLAVQSNGRVLIGGEFINYAGSGAHFFVRLTSTGALDNGFLHGTTAGNHVWTCTLQDDGKILLGGDFDAYNDTARGGIARVFPDGTLDLGFLPGTGANHEVNAITPLPDGRMLVGGKLTYYNNVSRHHLIRIASDGTLDTTFHEGPNWQVNGILLTADGRYMPYGGFTQYNGVNQAFIARVDSTGQLDPSFSVTAQQSGTVNAAVLQPDGKPIIGGDFSLINGSVHPRIARLTTTGAIDPSFNTTVGSNAIYCMVLQPDGKVLIGGNFTQVNGVTVGRIARLNPDGSLDAGFNPVSGADNYIWAIALQPDGRIMIGGDFTAYDGTALDRVARLNADGTLDPGFQSGPGFNSRVNNIVVRPDGKIVVSGNFTAYAGAGVGWALARLNTDGTLDAGFDVGLGARTNVVRTMALIPDDRLMIGGDFWNFNGTGRNRIARLMMDNSTPVPTATDHSKVEVSWLGDGRYMLRTDLPGLLDVITRDASGRLLHRSRAQGDVLIDLGSGPPGLYVVSLVSEKGMLSTRLVRPDLGR